MSVIISVFLSLCHLEGFGTELEYLGVYRQIICITKNNGGQSYVTNNYEKKLQPVPVKSF
jgi:hypothetical protein